MKNTTFILLISSFIFLSSGCVSGNKAEANLLKVEKQSTANEVDQYVTTAGRILDRLTRKDAER